MLGGKPIVLIIHAQTKPPLVELDEEVANLQDALRKAGGARRTADLTALNLARVLVAKRQKELQKGRARDGSQRLQLQSQSSRPQRKCCK